MESSKPEASEEKEVEHLAGSPSIEKFEPNIVAFLCNWCSYAGADLAGTSRKRYGPNVQTIRVMCSGRINPMFVIRAFQEGADGVLVGGCHPGDCHYQEGNYLARRRIAVLRELLEFIGIEKKRLKMAWISASEGDKFANVIDNVIEDIRELGELEKIKR